MTRAAVLGRETTDIIVFPGGRHLNAVQIRDVRCFIALEAGSAASPCIPSGEGFSAGNPHISFATLRARSIDCNPRKVHLVSRRSRIVSEFPSDDCPYRTTSISGKMRRQAAAVEIAKPSTYRTPNDILSR